MTRDSFFRQRRDWSQYKHDLLAKYLRVWVYKLASAYDDLAFVDTCAGEGLYDDGSLGSPLLAAQWNETYLAQRGKRLFVHACERREETRRRLTEVMRPYTSAEPAQAKVYAQPFHRVIDQVLDATKRVPTLFFVDPYGMKDITHDRIQPLLAADGRAPTEVLLRADPVLIARFAGWLRGGTGDRPRHAQAAGFEQLLRRLNVDTEDLQERVADDPNYSPDKMSLFASYLQAFRDRFRWVQLIPIRPSYYNAPKYFLIHATNSDHGAAFINDTASTTEDTLFEDTVEAENRAIGQISLALESERPKRYSLADLQRAVVETLRTEGSLSLIQLRAFLAERFGPDFRERHHKAVIRELVRQRVVVQDRDGPLSDKMALRLRQ